MASNFLLPFCVLYTIYISFTFAFWGTCHDTPDDLGLCTYCNSTNAHSLPNYAEVCRLYPNYVNFQPRPKECVFTGTDIIQGEDNPCCPYFPVGTRVLNLGSWTLDANSPFFDIPYQCDDIATQSACNPQSTTNGQYCNKHRWCAFLSGTVINKTAYRQFGKKENYTYCAYTFEVDPGQIGSGNFKTSRAMAGQQFIIPYIEELAMDVVVDEIEPYSLAPTRNGDTRSPSMSPTLSNGTASPTKSPTLSNDDKTAIIIGCVIGGTALLICIVLTIVCCIRNKDDSESVSDGSDLNENEELIAENQY